MYSSPFLILVAYSDLHSCPLLLAPTNDILVFGRSVDTISSVTMRTLQNVVCGCDVCEALKSLGWIVCVENER